jgi:hypothetical protein
MRAMQEGRQPLEGKGMSELAQAVVWIVLFSLVMAVWVYLWVPIPIF